MRKGRYRGLISSLAREQSADDTVPPVPHRENRLPTITIDCQVLGINTAVAGIGVGLAVPINARPVWRNGRSSQVIEDRSGSDRTRPRRQVQHFLSMSAMRLRLRPCSAVIAARMSVNRSGSPALVAGVRMRASRSTAVR